MTKPRTRSNGEGSVYKDGDRYVAAITLSMSPDGKPRRKKVLCATRREAVKELEKLQRLKEAGAQLLTNKQTTEQYLDYWLTNVKANQVRASSLATYRTLLRANVYSVVGRTVLTKLTPEHVQEVINRVTRDRTPGTARYVLTLLRMALNDALKRDMVIRNVAKVVDPPRGQSAERSAFTPDQVRALLRAAAGSDEEGVYWIALLAGMRQGEILGLRWAYVDLEQGTLDVRWSLTAVRGGIPSFGEPKTTASRRLLYLHDVLIDVLQDQRRKQSIWQKEAKLSGRAWVDYDLVFTNRWGGPITGTILRHRFAALLRVAGLPTAHFHDTRHACQSLLAELGVPERTSMDLLGHRDVETTRMVYTHASEAGKRRAALQIGDVFADLRKAV